MQAKSVLERSLHAVNWNLLASRLREIGKDTGKGVSGIIDWSVPLVPPEHLSTTKTMRVLSEKVVVEHRLLSFAAILDEIDRVSKGIV
jgi:hypothetical protein